MVHDDWPVCQRPRLGEHVTSRLKSPPVSGSFSRHKSSAENSSAFRQDVSRFIFCGQQLRVFERVPKRTSRQVARQVARPVARPVACCLPRSTAANLLADLGTHELRTSCCIPRVNCDFAVTINRWCYPVLSTVCFAAFCFFLWELMWRVGSSS